MAETKGFIRLHNATYDADTLVFVGDEMEFRLKLIERFNLDSDEMERITGAMDGCLGFTTSIKYKNTPNYVLYVRNFSRNDIKSLGTLAHEVLHVAFFILSDKGVEVDPHGTTEVINYLFTEIYESALKRLCMRKSKSGN